MTPTPTRPGGVDELRKRFDAQTVSERGVYGTHYAQWLESLVLSAESKHAEEMESHHKVVTVTSVRLHKDKRGRK